MIPRVATLGIIQASSAVKHNPDRQSLCSSQGSSAIKSLIAKDSLRRADARRLDSCDKHKNEEIEASSTRKALSSA
jgi:hypothetical protein